MQIMRNTRLLLVWRALCATLLLGTLATAIAQGRASGIVNYVYVQKLPLSEVAGQLSDQSGVPIEVKPGAENLIVNQLSISTPTALEKVLSDLSTALPEINWWQQGGTYYLDKSRTYSDVLVAPSPTTPGSSRPGGSASPLDLTTANSTTLSFTDPNVSSPPMLPPTGGGVVLNLPPSGSGTSAGQPDTMIREIIPLNYAKAKEIAWIFGFKGVDLTDANRKAQLQERIRVLFDFRNQSVINPSLANLQNGTGAYSNPLITPQYNTGAGSASYGGYGLTGAMQMGGGRWNSARQGYAPYNPLVNPNPNAVYDPNNPNGTGLNGTMDGAGSLQEYIPRGIRQIVGLLGLNALLVMAEDRQSIDQFEALIKALDQPVKQVIVEVMFVKMEIKDAMSIGSAWDFAGQNFSINNNADFGTVSGGSFLTRYVKGNLKVALGSLIVNHQAKIINAPRVIVPNGGTASFMMEDSRPFVIMNENTDIYGRTFSTPTVYMQVFSQGLTVNEVVVHPNDSVSLRVDPILEAPLGSVTLPGSSSTSTTDTTASILGNSRAVIDTRVMVKSGETMMMGGFVSKDEQQDTTTTPLLGKLPLIGPLLFSGRKSTTNNTEVMIFVTPTIVKDDSTDFMQMSMPRPLF
jgi:type II secretory pathway component GspD/PulD (secretin)